MSGINLKLITPSVPNYIFIEMPGVAQKQDGFKQAPKVSLADLSISQLESIAGDWRAALLDNAHRMRNNSEKD